MRNENIKKEYQFKKELCEKIENYYKDKLVELNLTNFSKVKSYLNESKRYQDFHIDRDIIFSQLDFEPFTTSFVKGERFSVVSGLNPSSPLHLGHKVMFDILIYLQKLGAEIYIPITDDESYLDNKIEDIEKNKKFVYEEIIPSIMAFGFNPEKTHIFLDSEYLEIYKHAIEVSKYVDKNYLSTVFGDKSLKNAGQIFYRGAVQLSQILLPQLIKNKQEKVLIPVGIDQHPYILVARDVAKKMKLTPPSELIFKFQPSLQNPYEKMSGSKPETAIYLSDTPEIIEKKINKAFTGAVSTLEGHKELGAIPEACSVFSLIYFHHPDNDFVNDIYEKYKSGKITTSDIKQIAYEFISNLIESHKNKT